jgi:hypothetical protein
MLVPEEGEEKLWTGMHALNLRLRNRFLNHVDGESE